MGAVPDGCGRAALGVGGLGRQAFDRPRAPDRLSAPKGFPLWWRAPHSESHRDAILAGRMVPRPEGFDSDTSRSEARWIRPSARGAPLADAGGPAAHGVGLRAAHRR